MPAWINQNTILNGQTVDLLPLEELHFNKLEILSKEKRIWEHFIFDGMDSVKFLKILNNALAERENGTQFPFVIYHKTHNRIIGSTRLMDIYPAHKKLEIGFTFLHPDYWGTEVNFECKLLLLTYCFETLKTVRVILKTDVKNLRSRKAIEKIGAKFEGIFRNDMMRENGTKRDSAYYSIIDSEWKLVKPMLTALYQNKINAYGSN